MPTLSNMLFPLVYQKKMTISLQYSSLTVCTTKISAFNKTFFEVGYLINGFVYRWIFLHGFKEEAKYFFYRATIVNANKNNDERMFYGQVRSMDETCDEIISQQNCFIIGQKTWENFKLVKSSFPFAGITEGTK